MSSLRNLYGKCHSATDMNYLARKDKTSQFISKLKDQDWCVKTVFSESSSNAQHNRYPKIASVCNKFWQEIESRQQMKGSSFICLVRRPEMGCDQTSTRLWSGQRGLLYPATHKVHLMCVWMCTGVHRRLREDRGHQRVFASKPPDASLRLSDVTSLHPE